MVYPWPAKPHSSTETKKLFGLMYQILNMLAKVINKSPHHWIYLSVSSQWPIASDQRVHQRNSDYVMRYDWLCFTVILAYNCKLYIKFGLYSNSYSQLLRHVQFPYFCCAVDWQFLWVCIYKQANLNYKRRCMRSLG